MFSDFIRANIEDKRILFVDDDTNVADMFMNLFSQGLGIDSNCAYDGEEALALFKKNQYDIVVSDIKMPKMNGIDMVLEMLKLNSNIKVIFVSAYKDEFYNKNLKEFRQNIAHIDKPISTHKFQLAFDSLYPKDYCEI